MSTKVPCDFLKKWFDGFPQEDAPSEDYDEYISRLHSHFRECPFCKIFFGFPGSDLPGNDCPEDAPLLYYSVAKEGMDILSQEQKQHLSKCDYCLGWVGYYIRRLAKDPNFKPPDPSPELLSKLKKIPHLLEVHMKLPPVELFRGIVASTEKTEEKGAFRISPFYALPKKQPVTEGKVYVEMRKEDYYIVIADLPPQVLQVRIYHSERPILNLNCVEGSAEGRLGEFLEYLLNGELEIEFVLSSQ